MDWGLPTTRPVIPRHAHGVIERAKLSPMLTDANGVTGLGYEGESLDSVIAKLASWNVTTLFDVRLNAISRKRGFSKTALSYGLAEAGIDYRHLPALGNSRDNRFGYAVPHTADGDLARSTFRSRLITPEAEAGIAQIVDVAAEARVAVFCFEANQYHCHREQVLDVVRARLGALVSL